ncbi:MAG: hypothetical protein BWY87_00207 [Deltaproteobacteria bacterium ADurb.Bin510]|nr:MAG: hypothetical protein BWY87_00207 [Deltaproteobacteria bacterium ADurb.Bin510]
MIIECPSCQSKFNLDDGQLTRERVKLRCRICSHVFVYEKRSISNLEQEFENLLTESESAALLNDQPEAPAEAAPDEAETAPEPENVTAELDTLLPQPAELTPLRRSRRALVAGLILALLVTGGAGAYYYLFLNPQPAKPPASRPALTKPAAAQCMAIAQESLAYELLPRENGETVLVIRGAVKRLTSRPVSSVLLEAKLCDEIGKLIETKQFYAGIVPQKEEFISQSSETIDSLLLAAPTAGSGGIDAKEIPFALAFFGASAKQAANAQIEVKQIKWQPTK